MDTSKKPGSSGCLCLLSSKFSQAMKERVHDDDVRVETIDSRRKDEIEAQSAYPAPSPTKRIKHNPEQELQYVRTGNRRHLVPGDAALPCAVRGGVAGDKFLYALGIKVNFATVIAGEAFQQFSECALCAVPAIYKR
jgi:hypothetical protein